MIRSRLCFVADSVQMHEDNGDVSASRIRDRIEAPVYPVRAPGMTFVCMLERGDDDPSTATAEFSISLGAQLLGRSSVQLDFLGFPRARIALRVEGLDIPGEGDVVFRLALQSRVLAEYRVGATQGARPATTGAAAPVALTIAKGEVRIR